MRLLAGAGAAPDLDLDLELAVKPVIAEVVRTQVCFPNLKLLVERIVVVVVPDVDELSGNEAYKLVLTDGEKTIQALVKRQIYKTIHSEDVREGSFVILKVYHLAQGQRSDGNGIVTYIVIEDFYSIGEDGRRDSGLQAIDEAPLEPGSQDVEDTRATSTKSVASCDGTDRLRDGALAKAAPPGRPGAGDDDIENRDHPAAAPTASPSSQELREAMKRKWDTALDEIDTNDTYRISKYRKLEEARAREAKEAAAASAKELLTRYQSLPTTPLVALTGGNKQRNTRHDILALIVSISAELIRRNGMPPKRDLRIMDISTIKKVSLSVFANAEDFQPEPGTVALFKNLTTHDYDGGSLNAYAKDCEGQAWFIPDPPGFENGEVAQLKDCWARLRFSEQVEQSTLSQINEPLEIHEDEDIADRLPTVSGKKHLTCFYWAKNGSCRYTDDECAYAHYNTGIVAHDPMHNQSTSTAVEKPTTKQSEPSGLPPSRSLTCFFWARNRKCNRSDEECSYAHYDTGTIARAPPGITVFEPAEEAKPPLMKTLTCYFWNRNGKCSRSDEECAYAHHHTGTVAYPPPNVVASLSPATITTPSRNDSEAQPKPSAPAFSSSAAAGGAKSLTCFFWARNGHCNRSDAQCAYAHYDTGTVAHNPNPALYPEPVHRPTTSSPAITIPAPTALHSPPRAPTIASALPSESTAISLAQITATAAPAAPGAASTTSPFPPVKHLTCYFWANFGRCKRSDQECNYAHFHTGKMAANPAELRKRSSRP
ncbi:MAG: hypothetical protein Q9207_008317 [Kuettlingeria erythrocarpa]